MHPSPPPKQKAARRVITRAGGKVEKTHRNDTPPMIDCAVAYLLRGLIHYSRIRDRVRRIGPELFPAGIVRDFAATVLRDVPFVPPDGKYSQDEIGAVCRALGEGLGEDAAEIDEAWADHLVNVVAEGRARPILASQLRWASDQVQQGLLPMSFIRAHVKHAFDLAAGQVLPGAPGWGALVMEAA